MIDEYKVRLAPSTYRVVSTIQDPLADSAYKIYTQSTTSDATLYLTFVNSNNNSATKEILYTNYGLTYNPAIGNLSIGSSIQISPDHLIYTPASFYIGNGSIAGITSFSGKIRLGGGEILSSSGNTVVGFAGTDAEFKGNVIVDHDLTVLGNFITNTPTLSIDGRTLEIGTANGGIGTANNTSWDLGIVFNYSENNTRKKTALIWEYSNKRYQFANSFSQSNLPSLYDSPQLVATSFAPVEMDSLWLNNSCTNGSKVVIDCLNNDLQLQNILIDEGEY
jgi:hypothetical protein